MLLNLPLRTCKAVPSPTWGKPMDADTFRLFKRIVIRMYILASTHLKGRLVPTYGFGLFKLPADGELKPLGSM